MFDVLVRFADGFTRFERVAFNAWVLETVRLIVAEHDNNFTPCAYSWSASASMAEA